MTIDQVIALAPHVAWPLAGLLGLAMILPFVSKLTSAIADARAILERAKEFPELVKLTKDLLENTSQLKAMSELNLASKTQPARLAPDIEALWERVDRSWQEVRERFRAAARSEGIEMRFNGAVSVREGADALTAKHRIDEKSANLFVDLWGKYQWMTKTSTPQTEYMNENVVSSFERDAASIKELLDALS